MTEATIEEKEYTVGILYNFCMLLFAIKGVGEMLIGEKALLWVLIEHCLLEMELSEEKRWTKRTNERRTIHQELRGTNTRAELRQ